MTDRSGLGCYGQEACEYEKGDSGHAAILLHQQTLSTSIVTAKAKNENRNLPGKKRRFFKVYHDHKTQIRSGRLTLGAGADKFHVSLFPAENPLGVRRTGRDPQNITLFDSQDKRQ
jgi:hypothetical protein